MQQFTRHSSEEEPYRQTWRKERQFRQREAWAFIVLGGAGAALTIVERIISWTSLLALRTVAVMLVLITLTFVVTFAYGLASLRHTAQFSPDEQQGRPGEQGEP